MDNHGVPEVNRAAILELDRQLSESPRQKRKTPTGNGGFSRLLGNPNERHVIGQKREEHCDDCGAVLVSVLNDVTEWLAVWEMPVHTCPEREARLAAVKEREAEARRLWLETPPAERVAQVRKRCRLPYWTPTGVAKLRADEVNPDLYGKLLAHRDLWVNGKRPEKGLWLWGPTDRRKTCSVCALLFDIGHRTERPAVYWTFERLLKHFRLSVGGRDNEYDPEQLERAHVLALDDIATVKLTEKAWEMLFDIIDTAYDGGTDGPSQTLYVTSNEDPGQVMQLLNAAAPPDGGERVVRRLVQMCEVVAL